MTKPTLEYEPRVPMTFWTPARRQKLRRVTWVHCVASYGTFGMLLAVEVLRGHQPEPIMFAWMILAPLATLVFIPLGIVIVFLPIEPSGKPLLIVGLPYLTIVLLVIWRNAERRRQGSTSGSS